MKRFLCLLAVMILVTACQSSTDTLSSAKDPPDLAGPAASAIAGDMVSRLAEQTPGASKSVKLPTDPSVFGSAMTAALNGWGYAISTDAKATPKPTELAYGIDHLDGQVLAHIETPSLALSRGYTVTATGATAATPLSVMRRD